MTDQEINIAVAEACGYVNCGVNWTGTPPEGRKLPDGLLRNLPDYCHDLNAMHEAEELLKDEQAEEYVWLLSTNMVKQGEPYAYPNHWRTAHATARQRAEAFLRTIGKWKDK